MNYEYTIIYKSTNHHGNADALSKLPCGPDEEFDKNVNVCNSVDEIYQNIIDDYPIDYKSIAEHTLSDPVLCNVSKFILNGWPKKLSVYDEMSYSHFFNRSESLNIYNNVILLQTEQYTRIVIPSSLQQKTLNLLHEGHWGITRTKQIARRYCWWPSIDKDIEKLIKACESCQLHASSGKKQFSPWPTTEKPWQRLHIDFAGPFLGKTYLVCVDSYTKFPFVIAMTQTTSACTIRALQQIFVIEGLPSTIVSDNGSQFTSAEFEQFCKANAIEHLTSAPFHPQSNGEAERFVRTFKTSMKKIYHDGINADMALMKFLSTYRTTPLPVVDKSPFELLHGRQPRTLLSAMLPLQERRVKFTPTTKYQFNNKVYTLDFSTRGKKWRKGFITKCLGRKMYMVQTNHGEWKRHENQLRPRISTTDQTPPKSILRDTTTNTRNQNLSNNNNNIPVVLDFGGDDDIPPSTIQTPQLPENPMDDQRTSPIATENPSDQPIVFRRGHYELRPKPHRC